MKKGVVTLFLILFSLSACVPYVMSRSQIHFGLKNWISGAATNGHLNVVFYNAPDQETKTAAL